jgi:hypothetical protein
MIAPMGKADATRRASCAIALLAAIAPGGAMAEDDVCRAPVEIEGARPRDYQPIFQTCRDEAGETRLAIRRMSVEDDALLLTVDPEKLTTSLERALCWRCVDTDDDAQQDTRYLEALRPPAGEGAQSGPLVNAGLVHGAGAGSFVTGDLCPSQRPLDRGFFDLLAKNGPGTPVALAVSGLWLTRHRADFEWLKEKVRAGALDITWVNHSYRHPYVLGRPETRNYLLQPGTDMAREILETERLMIAQGVTPSVFFRFPGLVADASALEAARRHHLITLGADSWLALGPPPRDGSIVLVHPNGNEPAGLRLFSRLLERGRLPLPLRPIVEAP